MSTISQLNIAGTRYNIQDTTVVNAIKNAYYGEEGWVSADYNQYESVANNTWVGSTAAWNVYNTTSEGYALTLLGVTWRTSTGGVLNNTTGRRITVVGRYDALYTNNSYGSALANTMNNTNYYSNAAIMNGLSGITPYQQLCTITTLGSNNINNEIYVAFWQNSGTTLQVYWKMLSLAFKKIS